MNKDAVFRIASMPKPVTGLAIMMMMEEGKLRITDPVSKYIPQFKDMKVAVGLPRQTPPPGARHGPPAAPPAFNGPPQPEITILRPAPPHSRPLICPPSNAHPA